MTFAVHDIPQVRYVDNDGTNIAYQVYGSGPVDVLLVPGFVSHIEYGWQEPLLARFLRRLAGIARVIAFDKRGMGLSDRQDSSRASTLAQRMADLLAVMNAADSASAVLLGWSEGGPTAIAFSLAHPERVGGLVLCGTTARFVAADDFDEGIPREVLELFIDTFGAEWGTGVGWELYAPSLADDDRARAWWSAYQRFSASPGAVVATLRAQLEVDVRPLLARIAVPTAVLHRTQDMIIPVECGRYLTQHIPDAVLVEQPSEDHMYWVGLQDATLNAIRELLRRTPGGAAAPTLRQAPRRTRTGWESLTAAELDVVRLVAEGMTNRQIGDRLSLSHRTVQTHVTHVLAKLDLRRRAELAAEATRRARPR